MKSIVESQIRTLKSEPVSVLENLPAHQKRMIRDGRSKIALSVWKDRTPERQLRIVVQAYRHFFLGIGRMEAKGFLVDSTGGMRDLTREEIYDFI